MKRILIDYKKLSHEVAALLIETYPEGYGDDDIIRFKNSAGEFIQAVELRTEDTLYLVKISKSLSNFISNFDDSIEKELDSEEIDHDDEHEMELNLEQDPDEEADYDSDYD
jgi:hypothetical protein